MTLQFTLCLTTVHRVQEPASHRRGMWRPCCNPSFCFVFFLWLHQRPPSTGQHMMHSKGIPDVHNPAEIHWHVLPWLSHFHSATRKRPLLLLALCLVLSQVPRPLLCISPYIRLTTAIWLNTAATANCFLEFSAGLGNYRTALCYEFDCLPVNPECNSMRHEAVPA